MCVVNHRCCESSLLTPCTRIFQAIHGWLIISSMLLLFMFSYLYISYVDRPRRHTGPPPPPVGVLVPSVLSGS